MDGNSLRNLQEAYLQVHQEVEQLDEGRWSSLSALSRESQKRKEDKERGRPETEAETHGRLMLGKFRIGASKEERAEGGRQRLKDRDKVPKKGGKDMFEQVLEYLVAEGYADTNKAAIAIMANMSEEWKQSIMEVVTTTGERAPKAVPSQMFPGRPFMGANKPFQEPFVNPSGDRGPVDRSLFKGASKPVKKDTKTA